MKILIWAVFVLLALLWTGTAYATAALVHWGVGWLGTGQALDVSQVLAGWSIPAWLTYWVDVSDISALFDSVRWALEGLQGAWPGVGAVLQWLVPATWVVWGLVMLLMLAVAAGLHVLVGRATQWPARQDSNLRPPA